MNVSTLIVMIDTHNINIMAMRREMLIRSTLNTLRDISHGKNGIL